jgi:hypothetical protein
MNWNHIKLGATILLFVSGYLLLLLQINKNQKLQEELVQAKLNNIHPILNDIKQLEQTNLIHVSDVHALKTAFEELETMMQNNQIDSLTLEDAKIILGL